MRRALAAALVAAGALTADALSVPVRRVARRTPAHLRKRATSDSFDLSTYNDMLYIANVTVGGKDYSVQLDTGSSDLWINGTSYPLPNVESTSTTLNITYGAGWAFGSVSYAPAAFADINIPKQAFLDAASADNAVLQYGAVGVLGLGFNSLSNIDGLLNSSASSSGLGRSLLYNLFYDNPSTPNFIAFSLQRSTDTQDADDVEGTFSVGELEPKYADAVGKADPISTFPVADPKRWNVLLDALLVGNTTVPVSSTVDGAPSNKAVVLLDSGSSFTYAPTAVVNAIYGSVPGASFNAADELWRVPCTAEVDMAFQFNGQVYPLHPLDVVIKSGAGADVCVGTFIPQDTSAIGAGQVDWIAGDNFLRSVYSVYDFGDFDAAHQMGDPYVKLVALTDPDAASADFARARGTTAKTGITYNAAHVANAGTTVSVSSNLESTLDRIDKYMPILLGLLAFNALAVVLAAAGGLFYLCRRRRSNATGTVRARKTRGRATPLPLEPLGARAGNTDSYADGGFARDSSYPILGARDSVAPGRDSYMDPGPLQSPAKAGGYTPVSMALTDDAFVPPSPAFSRYGDGGGGGGRPKSMA